MTVNIPVPNDATYDYIPIAGPQVQVGTNLLSLWTVQGDLTQRFAPSNPAAEEFWVYFMSAANPDGSLSVGVALFPETPSLLPAEWWGRFAIWKRAAKLVDGGTLTAADGSKWIYAAGSDGRMGCYVSGSNFSRGDRRFRGELTTDPDDLWICDDPDWDWLPITDGSQVDVGDTITFLMAATEDVDAITVTDNGTYMQHTFIDTDTSAQIGWYDVVVSPDVPSVVDLNTWTFFEKLAKPALEAMFRAPDGSRWIYVGSSLYYCWGAGTAYAPGALFLRGEIAGGLTALM